MSFSYDDIELLISRPHRGVENQEDLNQFLHNLPTGESRKKLGTRS